MLTPSKECEEAAYRSREAFLRVGVGWVQREIPSPSLPARRLPSPHPTRARSSSDARVLAAISRVTSIKPQAQQSPRGEKKRPDVGRQYVADGIPLTKRKSLQQQNPNNSTWSTELYFLPISVLSL